MNEKTAASAKDHYLNHYVAAFNSGDPELWASTIDVPSLWMPDERDVHVFQTRDEVRAFCAQYLSEVKAAGTVRSEISDLDVQALSPNAALVHVRARRLATDAASTYFVFGAYLMRRAEGEWRMTALFGGRTS